MKKRRPGLPLKGFHPGRASRTATRKAHRVAGERQDMETQD